jgi:hypothetical protein
MAFSLSGVYRRTYVFLSLAVTMALACIERPPKTSASLHAPSSGAGRTYWAEMAQQLGLVDTTDGIFFVRSLPSDECFPVPGSDDGPGVYRKTAENKR